MTAKPGHLYALRVPAAAGRDWFKIGHTTDRNLDAHMARTYSWALGPQASHQYLSRPIERSARHAERQAFLLLERYRIRGRRGLFAAPEDVVCSALRFAEYVCSARLDPEPAASRDVAVQANQLQIAKETGARELNVVERFVAECAEFGIGEYVVLGAFLARLGRWIAANRIPKTALTSDSFRKPLQAVGVRLERAACRAWPPRSGNLVVADFLVGMRLN